MSFAGLGGHRKVTVMGLGLFGGGLGAARFWRSLGSEVTVTDLRSEEQLAESVAALEGSGVRLVLGRHEPQDFITADLVMVNPAVPPNNKFVNIAREAGARLQTEVGLALSLHKGPVLAVTGSNGKSTTTALLGTMLQAHNPDTLIGGNIGGSVLEEIRTHLPSAPLVLELSSFQLHYLRQESFAPDVAVVTNLAPNHLDWHKTLLHYYESKRNLLHFQRPEQYAILNYDDSVLRDWQEDARAKIIWTSPQEPQEDNCCFLRAGKIVLRLEGGEIELADISALHLPGEHNRLNALQAAAAAYAFCKSPSAVAEGLQKFSGLPHRLEEVAHRNGRRFINDSIATTPESAICGLRSFDAPVVIIAGGYDKGMSLEEFGKEIGRRAHALVLVGQTADMIATAAQADNPTLPVFHAREDFAQAVRKAEEFCPEGGIVLLSPGCASYGMFTNFRERGDFFGKLARGEA